MKAADIHGLNVIAIETFPLQMSQLMAHAKVINHSQMQYRAHLRDADMRIL